MKVGHFFVDDQAFDYIIKKYDLAEVSIFGSALRDDFSSSSDYDLLVIFNKSKEKSLFDLIDLKNELEELFGRNVDIVEKDALLNPYRREEILKTAKVIYAA
jgi:uncharacterized protein